MAKKKVSKKAPRRKASIDVSRERLCELEIEELRKRFGDIDHRVCKASETAGKHAGLSEIVIRAESRLAAVEKSLVDMDHYIKGEMRTQIAQEIDLELRIRLNAYQGKYTQDALAAIIDPISINRFRNMLFDLKRILESKKGRRWVQREIQRGVREAPITRPAQAEDCI